MDKQIDVTNEIESLVRRAEKAEKADDAMKLSQAACNAANAMACIRVMQYQTKG